MSSGLRFGHRAKRDSFISFVFGRPSLVGVVLAGLGGWLSLTPSLLPRNWLNQALITGLCIAVFYGVGSLFGWLYTLARGRSGREFVGPSRRMWLVSITAVLMLTLVGIVLWPVWQNDQGGLVELEELSAISGLLAVVVGVAIGDMLVIVGRVIAFGIRGLDRWLAKRIPKVVAYLAVAIVVGVSVYVFTVDVVANGFFNWANDRYGSADQVVSDEVVQPTSALKSGSPESLVAWESVGTEGRVFLSGAASVESIEDFTGSAVLEPIRVYAGLLSADTPEDRANLVVEELHRTGGFDRAHLVVVATTGTGWVDPDAAQVAEHMYGGDTAIAAMQYSYLPSWISFLVDAQKSAAAGEAIFDAVVGEWERLPDDGRPVLTLFGESLGSYGAEQAVGGGDLDASVEEAERADGVILLGPTNQNVLWNQLIDARETDTPIWRPHVDTHPELIVANLVGDVGAAEVGPGLGNILYYHHPSDPVGYWNWETLWQPQGWTQEPIGYDVSPNADWYPFVTFWQVTFDLIAGFAAPSGFGHNYAIDMPYAWAGVAAPSGWDDAETHRLADHLDLGGGGDSSG